MLCWSWAAARRTRGSWWCSLSIKCAQTISIDLGRNSPAAFDGCSIRERFSPTPIKIMPRPPPHRATPRSPPGCIPRATASWETIFSCERPDRSPIPSPTVRTRFWAFRMMPDALRPICCVPRWETGSKSNRPTARSCRWPSRTGRRFSWAGSTPMARTGTTPEPGATSHRRTTRRPTRHGSMSSTRAGARYAFTGASGSVCCRKINTARHVRTPSPPSGTAYVQRFRTGLPAPTARRMLGFSRRSPPHRSARR